MTTIHPGAKDNTLQPWRNAVDPREYAFPLDAEFAWKLERLREAVLIVAKAAESMLTIGELARINELLVKPDESSTDGCDHQCPGGSDCPCFIAGYDADRRPDGA